MIGYDTYIMDDYHMVYLISIELWEITRYNNDGDS